MRSASPDKAANGKDKGLRLLLWPLVAAIIFGLIGFGEVLEDALRISRNAVRSEPVSGEIVLVEIDDSSLREVGSWPWPRATQGKLIEEIDRLGAGQIVMDILYAAPSSRADDAALAKSIAAAGNVTLGVQNRIGDLDGKHNPVMPQPAFVQNARLAAIGVYYNWQNAAWEIPYGGTVEGRKMASLAAGIAGVTGPQDKVFRIDYAFDADSIPRVSAANILAGRIDRSAIEGKTIVVGTNSMRIGDQYLIPGLGKRGGVFIHVLAAETLKKGEPVDLGWIPALLAALAAAAFALHSRRKRVMEVSAVAICAVSSLSERALIYVDAVPGLFVLGVVT